MQLGEDDTMKNTEYALSEVLELYEEEELQNFAERIGLTEAAKQTKEELLYTISQHLLDPEVLRRRIACMNEETRFIFEKACEKPFMLSSVEIDNALWLRENFYGFVDERKVLSIPADVREVYEKINTPEFQEYAKKMSWLVQCLNFSETFYGIFQEDVIFDMYHIKKGFVFTYPEMYKMISEIPDDFIMIHMWKEKKCFTADYLRSEQTFDKLLKLQWGNDFYWPTEEQILDYDHNMYFSEEPSYVRLREFLQKTFGLTPGDQNQVAQHVWRQFHYRKKITEVYDEILESIGLESLRKQHAEKLTDLLIDCNNHTRLQIHRGYTPLEVSEFKEQARKAREEREKALKAKALAAKKAEEAAQNAKVYPNDPCPCGSGKKYKHCCGKQ